MVTEPAAARRTGGFAALSPLAADRSSPLQAARTRAAAIRRL